MSQQELVKSSNGSGVAKREPLSNGNLRAVAPPVDIYENEQELLLVSDLPGVDPDALQISLDPPELRFEARNEKAGTVYARVFRVDDRIDPEGISAELVQGVLRVHLKKSETLRPRRISVRSS
jgi:HSP20 family molecular chaperone IbpA